MADIALPSFDTMVTNTMPGTQSKRISAPALVCPSLATDLLSEAAYKYDVDRSIQAEACIHTRVMHNKYVRLVYVENAADPDKIRSLAISDTNHRELRHLVSCFNIMCKACKEYSKRNDKHESVYTEHTYLCRQCYEVILRHAHSPVRPVLCERCCSNGRYHPKLYIPATGSTRRGAPIPSLECQCPSCGSRVRRIHRDRTDSRFMCNRCLLEQSHTS